MNSIFCSRSRAVSSRGCSKAFIVCVLHRALQYVKQLHIGAFYPFRSNLVEMWLELAKNDCGSGAFKNQFWGTEFDLLDPTTYWIDPQQFFTWWKNNVERKCKFLSLRRDASYEGDSEKQLKRAFFCNVVIALAINIRNHFERHRIPGHPVPQVPVPIESKFLSEVTYPQSVEDGNHNNSDMNTDFENKRKKRVKKSEKTNCKYSKSCQLKCVDKAFNHTQHISHHAQPISSTCHHCSHKYNSRNLSSYNPSHCHLQHHHQHNNNDSESTVGLLQLQNLRQNLKLIANDNIIRKKCKVENFSNEQLLHLRRLIAAEDRDQGIYSNSEYKMEKQEIYPSPRINSDNSHTTSASNGFTYSMSTDEPLLFPVTTTPPPIDETLDISDIDFDALICEGSEVDWIDEVVSDYSTTDVESSTYNSHNNSYYPSYDPEEVSVLQPSTWSTTNHSYTSNNTSNNSSYSNINESFSKKLTLKRMFEDLTNVDMEINDNKSCNNNDARTSCDKDTIDINSIQSHQTEYKTQQEKSISCKKLKCPQIATPWPVRINCGGLLGDSNWREDADFPASFCSDDSKYFDISGFDTIDSDSQILEYFEI